MPHPAHYSPTSLPVPFAAGLLALATLSWSGNHIIARAVSAHVPSWSISLCRWTVVAALLAAFCGPALRADWPRIKRQWLVLAFLGIIGGGVFGALQFIGLKYTGALNMGVINSVGPAFIALASFLIFRDRLRPVQMMGIAISFAGVLAMVTKLDPHILATFAFNKGDLILVLNMSLWAIYSACLRMRPAIAMTSFLCVIAISAALTSLPFAILEYGRGERLIPDAVTFGTLAYSSLISSLLGYLCWGRGVEVLGVARAGAFLHLVPVFAALLATSLLGEHLGLHHLAGFALILTGVTLAVRPAAVRAGDQQPAEQRRA